MAVPGGGLIPKKQFVLEGGGEEGHPGPPDIPAGHAASVSH